MTSIQQMKRRYELEAEMMGMESRQKELRNKLPELRYGLREAEGTQAEYEGGIRRIFDRLAGKQEENRERLSAAVRAAKAALDQAERELAMTERQLASVRAETEQLPPRQELMARLEPGEQEHFRKLEASLCAEGALELLRENRKTLERAMEEARPDVRVGRVASKNELLQRSAELARLCREKLGQIADCGILLEVHPYFENPAGYIACVAAQYGELDRINSALKGIRETEIQLRELILQLTE